MKKLGILFMFLLVLIGYPKAIQVHGSNQELMRLSIETLSESLVLESDMVIQLSLGEIHTSVLTQEGKVFIWGGNIYGQLGNNSTVNSSVPIDITSSFGALGADKIIQLSMGHNHSSALTQEGRVFMWGYGLSGQLGNNSSVNSNVPIEITSQFGALDTDKIIQLSLGNAHSSALTQEGKVFIWGHGYSGQLGNSSNSNSSVPINITSRFGALGTDKIIQLSMGTSNSSALTQEGKVFTWGVNVYGQLGNNSTVSSNVPINITSRFNELNTDKIIQISIVGNHSSALTQEGKLFMWGYNLFGQLGNNSTLNSLIPIEITNQFNTLGADKIIQVSIGEYHTSALTQEGKVFMWGLGSSGQLGRNSTVNSNVPIEITSQFDALGTDKIKEASIGGNHSSALTQEGMVFMWGRGNYGQLGNNTTIQINVPTMLEAVSPSQMPTITFNVSGGSELSSITQEANTAVSTPTAPTKVGYAFGGWYSDSGLTNVYTFTTMPAESITLYAKWNAVDYDITYALNGGSNHINNPATYHIETPTITLGTPTKTGHTFGGWYDNADTTGSAITQVVLGSQGNKTLYANWTIHRYTITFDSNGGSAVTSITQDYNTNVLVLTAPTKTDYTFGGWYSDSGLTNTYTLTTMPAESITLYAKWNAVDYDITYALNGGSNHINNPATYHIETPTITLGTPTKTGHTFVGWYDNADSTGSAITQVVLGSQGNKTLYANWTINQYTITFDSNGGSAVASITQDYNTNVLAPTAPTKTGFTYNGWSPIIPSMMPAENITVTARWLKEAKESQEIIANVDGLIDAINPDIVEGKDVEVVIHISIKASNDILETESSAIASIGSNDLNIRKQGILYIDISVIIKAQGDDDFNVNVLTQMITITIGIPLDQQGHKNYQIVRVHDGVAQVLNSIYDEEAQTITFETDRFSTYAIIFDTSSGLGLWWLLLILLIPIIYVGYRYRDVIQAKLCYVVKILKR